MEALLDRLFELLEVVPVETVYLLVALGAALENLFPPIPSDTFVVLGGILADRGMLEPEIVLAAAWLANILLGFWVYAMGRRYGRTFFDTRWGRWLLRPHQLRQMSAFYERYGSTSIFVSRFFPLFRVLVPAFAGISRLGFWRMAVPLSIASGLWYAALLWVGILASRNIPRIVGWIEQLNAWLVAGALVLAAAIGAWWWWTRAREEG